MHTDIWSCSFDEIHNIPIEFNANLKQIDMFIHSLNLYYEWKIKLQQENVILCHYDEFDEKNNFKVIVEKISTYDNRKISCIKKLYSLEQKEKIIINYNEVKEYFETNK